VSELSPEQLAPLRAALTALAAELRSLLEMSAEGSRPVDLDEPIGRISRMDAIAQQNMAKANRRSSQLRLQQVEAALVRCENGEYGDCLACGETVGLARLEVRPEAPLCIGCQGLREGRR